MKHLDKLLHFAAGGAIAFLAWKFTDSRSAAFVISTFAGICKEIYDLTKPETHKASFVDLLFTVWGATLVYAW